jgi:hypothetical protein
MNRVILINLFLIGVFFYVGCSPQDEGKSSSQLNKNQSSHLTCGQSANIADPLSYQIRGDRCEGRVVKQTGAPILEMVSATLGMPKAKHANPTSFTLSFYLKETAEVDITVQELEPDEDYLMDNVSPQGGWTEGWNNYSWATSSVINKLGLKINDLGVIAKTNSSRDAWIVPVALYDSDLPFEVNKNYWFVYRLYQKVSWLNYAIFREEGSTSLLKKRRPLSERWSGYFEIPWDASDEPEGVFKLVLNGQFSDGTQIHKTVHFYHVPTLNQK